MALDFNRLKKALKKSNRPEKVEPELPPLERLYQEVHARIHQEIYNISIEPKRGPSCHMDDVQQHYGRHYGLLSLHQDMSEKLDQLEDEYDTLDLRLQLTYIDQYLHYVKAMVDCSYELMHYKEALVQAEAEIIQLDQQVHQTHAQDELKLLDQGLEHLLDRQDKLTTQYQDFIYRGLDPVTVTPAYQAYLQKITRLQDTLDETRNWLG